MKKILSLCINLLLLIISNAVPIQLIPGDRSVVKKDGATHTISKYYVVPNDFDPNNVTNSTEASQKTTVRMNHTLYSKSMNANTASQDQVSQKRAEAANDQTNKNNVDANNTEVNLRSSLNVTQVDVATPANDNTAESTGSVNTRQTLDPEDLGNLQVEPITNSIILKSSVTINEINVHNSSEALQNGTSLIVENVTQTFERDVEDEFDELILTKFGIAVHESSVQNLESFWKLIKLTIGRISDDDELLAKIERLSLLLNIFTNLYEAAKLQIPIESMIDSIIDILQIPFVEKSNTSTSQSQTNVSGDFDEECLRKCGLKRSKPQLDSNGTYLTETESLERNENLELEKLDLQRRQIGILDDGWVNTSNDPVSNEVTVSNQPTNILRSQLLVPNNLNVGVPDGYNVRSSVPMPTLNHVTRNNDFQEDPKSNQTFPDSAETGDNTDDQPLTIESRLTDDLPWNIEDKTTDYLPWHIEEKLINDYPFTIEHRTTHTLPWTIEDKGTKKVPWKVENRADPNWIIENKIGHSPITLYQSRDPSIITHGGKILLDPNQPMTGTVHNVKHGFQKPYHIYTYVINPVTSLYETSNSGNIVKVKSRQPTLLQPNTLTLDSQTNSNQLNEESQIPEAGSHPGILLPNVLSNPFKSLQNIGNNEPVSTASVSASTFNPDIGDTEPNPYNPNINVNLIQQPNSNPGLISKSSFHSEYTNIPDNYDKPSPVYGEETHKYPGLISTASSSSTYTNLPDKYDDEPVYGDQTYQHPALISSSASSNSKYTNLLDDYDEPSPVYGEHTDKHPGLISTSSSSSVYTNLPDDYDEPVYGGQTHQHPDLISSPASSSFGYTNLPDEYDKPVYDDQTHQHPALISSSASSNSAYTNLPDDYDEPSPVYGGHTDKHLGLISTPSSSSVYTNLPDNYDEPVYGGQTPKHPDLISSSASSSSGYTNLPDEYYEPVYDVIDIQSHQHPGLISSSASSNSEYKKFADSYDEQNSVYGGQTHKHPGFISKASTHSEYKKLPIHNPKPNYGQYIDTHPGLITKVNHYPEYANIVNDYDEQIPVYSGEIHKRPGFLSKASSHSEYTNLPNDYNNPTDDYEKDTGRYPVHFQTPVNGRPTENEDNLLVPYHPYGHTVHVIQPSLIAHLHGNQPTEHSYLKHLKLNLAPTYRLFTLDNLLKLYDVVIKRIEVNGDKPDVYDNRALMNLRKIINLILILAEHLEEPKDSIEWYLKIFYNTQKNRHPLEIYVYNLIRQRWLHELMLVLHKNDFNINILQNPRIYSFLGSWQFPDYVLNFIEAKGLIQHNFDASEVFDQTLSTHHSLQDKLSTYTYDDLLEKVPEDLESYVTNNVINSYKTPNTGIVLSIAGVEAEPDANAIINILQKYLHYKSFIEKQENVIIRDNKVEMLKRIILFLREKGYDANTIADLIQKLYTAVYSTEGKGCQAHHTNFAKNMYDIILPVLRRSGR